MDIDYTVTALMFPAIPLIMGVYSNRFHTLSNLIRKIHDEHVFEKHTPPEWKNQLIKELDKTILHMKDEPTNFPDPNDRATQESEFGLELRARDRERKLLRKINSAIQRVDDKSYGYCEQTGDEIGLRRLEARPVATLSLEAQERRELQEKQYRDADDYYR